MAPTYYKQINVLHSAWISHIRFVLGYRLPAAPDPARIIGVQLTQLQLMQPIT